MKEKLFDYINKRFDDDGVLPSEDEIYQAFAISFDNGISTELINEVMFSFMSIHDLSNITIKWEGHVI